MTSEVLTYLPDITTGLALIGFALAFSFGQRTFIKERDGKCQLPEKHDCNTGDKDQIHHIIPFRYSKEMGIENPDFVENGIRLCMNAHVGEISPGVPGAHPDMIETKKQYKQNKNAFSEMFEARKKKLENREPYWNTKWDRLFHVIAIRNTQRFEREGHPIPIKRGRKVVG